MAASDNDNEDKKQASDEVIDLVESEEDENEGENQGERSVRGPAAKSSASQPFASAKPHNPYAKQPSETVNSERKRVTSKLRLSPRTKQSFQAGLVLEQDVDTGSSNKHHGGTVDDETEATITPESYEEEQRMRQAQGKPAILFHDPDFETVPSSIEGTSKKAVVKCRCKGSPPAKLSYKARRNATDGGYGNVQYPYYHCAQNKCNYFSWAFQAETLAWYRFGRHTGHVIVQDEFRASDLCQGRVGDCWFLSALAVVAERPDLIGRLFNNGKFCVLNEYGVVQVTLFLDGYWKTVVLDNFLPCVVDSEGEKELQQAMEASLAFTGTGRTINGETVTESSSGAATSSNDPNVVADKCREVLRATAEFLEQHQARTTGSTGTSSVAMLKRPATSQDLAYSKAAKNQLWVPFLEKAYAKSHGCYKAISGGEIAEAFLDLTGAPTRVFNFDSKSFEPRRFWAKLLQFRRQRLPMGCGTSSSAAGIIGMHAYSILDVKEVKNVSFRFFQETGVAHGNVSGFTEYDGTVRLLQIRNPHGKGEWKGEFSDKSDIWEKLLQHQEGPDSPGLQRTMRNDGIFWIDYDSFLMGFSNVVVLAFLGNHGKSFASNFAAKKSNHRCVRAFEVLLLDPQPGVPNRDTVELYVMGIQKTRRGASRGRSDRKESYKVCDLGMLLGENHDAHGEVGDDAGDVTFSTVRGQMFGFTRNGHYRLMLDRKKNKSAVVMPISFGHPAATDKELSFVLRFVSDAPLMIRELPSVPRMDVALKTFCLSPAPLNSKQGLQRVILEDPSFRLVQVDCLGDGGGTVFLYLCINQDKLQRQGISGVSFTVEANCRGMSCRTEKGLLQHETVAKGKKFEAAWRRYTSEFIGENKSRLLLVLFQSGQDTEFGAIVCKRIHTSAKASKETNTLDSFLHVDPEASSNKDYTQRGVFNGVDGNDAYELSGSLGANIGSAGHRGDYQQGLDNELERALALSRGDLELQKALELSSQRPKGDQSSTQFDADLQRALEMSKMDSNGSSVDACGSKMNGDCKPAGLDQRSNAAASPAMSYEDELAKAIKLSMQDTKPSAGSKTKESETIDLTEDKVPSKRRKTDDFAVGMNGEP